MNALVAIQVAVHDRHSFLRSAYAETPFKVANISEGRHPRQLHLMLMSSSPGILEGDNYTIDIALDENSALQLSTQSYQRLFSMTGGAGQALTVRMAKGSSFVYLPHPVVPHALSVFRASGKIYLADECSVTWAEIFTCGRKLSGERFLFSFYQSVTEIFWNDKLMIKENLVMAPGKTDAVMQQLEGFTHQASMICLWPRGLVAECKAAVSEYLSRQQDILYGVTAASVNGVIIRLLGNSAEHLFDCIKKLNGILHLVKLTNDGIAALDHDVQNGCEGVLALKKVYEQ